MKPNTLLMSATLATASMFTATAYADSTTRVAAASALGSVAGTAIGKNMGGTTGATIGAALGGAGGAARIATATRRPDRPPDRPARQRAGGRLWRDHPGCRCATCVRARVARVRTAVDAP